MHHDMMINAQCILQPKLYTMNYTKHYTLPISLDSHSNIHYTLYNLICNKLLVLGRRKKLYTAHCKLYTIKCILCPQWVPCISVFLLNLGRCRAVPIGDDDMSVQCIVHIVQIGIGGNVASNDDMSVLVIFLGQPISPPGQHISH